ncbi:hypothetical protein AAFG22_14775 [Bradyrhizobium sp. B024]|uniref:hypothetical protein n=1 Tax=Bradyrhizobium sp. B024 TaxID=3140247 RepID=UPI0031834168
MTRIKSVTLRRQFVTAPHVTTGVVENGELRMASFKVAGYVLDSLSREISHVRFARCD